MAFREEAGEFSNDHFVGRKAIGPNRLVEEPGKTWVVNLLERIGELAVTRRITLTNNTGPNTDSED